MIRLTLPWLVFVYMMVFLATIFTAWIAYEMVRRFREGRFRGNRIRCALCGMEYEDRSPEPLPRCPRCRSLNERTRVKIY